MKTTINNKLFIELELNEMNPDVLSYLSSLEISSKSTANPQDIDSLSTEISANWWKNNKTRFIDEISD